MTQDTEKIHSAVKERYASRAGSATSSSCCGPEASCGSAEMLYADRDLADLPEAANLSLGCGDPLARADLRPGETVLDLGSGGGLDCFLAAKEVGPEGHVIGVDMTPEMIERAEANKAVAGFENVEFRLGQIEALPIDDASVDVILSNCVINLAPDKGAVFREAFRVLKPAGRVSISDIVTDGPFDETIRGDLDQWAECVAGALEADTYMGLLRDAGFAQVEIVDQVSAESIVARREGMPRLFSASIVGVKPG